MTIHKVRLFIRIKNFYGENEQNWKNMAKTFILSFKNVNDCLHWKFLQFSSSTFVHFSYRNSHKAYVLSGKIAIILDTFSLFITVNRGNFGRFEENFLFWANPLVRRTLRTYFLIVFCLNSGLYVCAMYLIILRDSS